MIDALAARNATLVLSYHVVFEIAKVFLSLHPGPRSARDSAVLVPCGRRGESTCYAKRSKRKKTARSYAALRRAAYYPLSLPPYRKAFMAFLGFWQTASLRSAIVLLNWSPAQRCQRSTNPPVEAFFWELTTGTIVLISEGPLPSRPEPICRSNTPGIPVWSGFRPDRFLVYFVLRETFWN